MALRCSLVLKRHVEGLVGEVDGDVVSIINVVVDVDGLNHELFDELTYSLAVCFAKFFILGLLILDHLPVL